MGPRRAKVVRDDEGPEVEPTGDAALPDQSPRQRSSARVKARAKPRKPSSTFDTAVESDEPKKETQKRKRTGDGVESDADEEPCAAVKDQANRPESDTIETNTDDSPIKPARRAASKPSSATADLKKPSTPHRTRSLNSIDLSSPKSSPPKQTTLQSFFKFEQTSSPLRSQSLPLGVEAEETPTELAVESAPKKSRTAKAATTSQKPKRNGRTTLDFLDSDGFDLSQSVGNAAASRPTRISATSGKQKRQSASVRKGKEGEEREQPEKPVITLDSSEPETESLSTQKALISVNRKGSGAQDFFKKWIINGENRPKPTDLSGLESKKSHPDDVCEDLWVDKHNPLTEQETAVHKNKVAEVRRWLLSALCGTPSQPWQTSDRILILTGPSGAGKSAVVRMLSRELDFEILEWINPVNPSRRKAPEFASQEYITTTSLSQKFQDFLFQASKAPTLQFLGTEPTPSTINSNGSPDTDSKRKIVLIEDLPNATQSNMREACHAAVRRYASSSRTAFPLVFIVTDIIAGDGRRGGGGSSSLRWRAGGSGGGDETVSIKSLIPDDVLNSQCCSKINFNPVAETYLLKALNRIADIEFRVPARRALRPQPEYLRAVARSSGGDLRCAINAMQFLSLKRTHQAAPPSLMQPAGKAKRGSKKEGPLPQLDYVGGKEHSLLLFHALGKVLYNKREDADNFCPKSLDLQIYQRPTERFTYPDHMKLFERAPMKIDPEFVIESSHNDPATFVLFLQQNYPRFFTSIDDILSASTYFSDADVLFGSWEHQSVLDVYGGSVAARATMFTQSPDAPPRPKSLRVVHKPEWFASNRAAKESAEAVGRVVEGEWIQRWIREVVGSAERDEEDDEPESGESGGEEEGFGNVEGGMMGKRGILLGRYGAVTRGGWSKNQFCLSGHFQDTALIQDILPYLSVMDRFHSVRSSTKSWQLGSADRDFVRRMTTFSARQGPQQILDEHEVEHDDGIAPESPAPRNAVEDEIEDF
ncbi:Rad17 cell cycle checkpoint protein-domain-containing protein [Cladochytrium replicatum]|nr:Rad17 cell cycle checkpoint protein-domain-containing protein [Cladochytrium replicatum]